MTIRTIVTVIAASVATAMMAAPAHAQSYPNQPVRLLVPYAPGGTTDVIGRLVAQGLSEELGTQVVVENRTGAGGMVATDAVAKSPPNGYTLLFAPTQMSTFHALFEDVPFDPVADFQPIGQIATTPYVIVVHPSLPIESLEDLIAYAAENPGELSHAASSPGSAQHLAMESIKAQTDVDILYVPYGGTGDLLPDLLAGRLDAAVDNVAIFREYIEAGSLRALAVTGDVRSAVLPDVPTAAEAGLENFSIVGWFGVFAPAGTPDAIVETLNTAINSFLTGPEIGNRLEGLGAEAFTGTPEDLSDRLEANMTVFGDLIADLGITPN